MNATEQAICDVCGWEGTEDEVLEKSEDGTIGDTCPNCNQPDVNYFLKGSYHD